jgi:hypothetical protein
MSKLFMEASQRLRDELVTQLQNEVNFLKNYLAKNKKDSLVGTKVIVIPSPHMGDTLHLESPLEGILLTNIHNSSIYAHVMIKNEDNTGRIIHPYICDIRFPNVDKLFNY